MEEASTPNILSPPDPPVAPHSSGRPRNRKVNREAERHSDGSKSTGNKKRPKRPPAKSQGQSLQGADQGSPSTSASGPGTAPLASDRSTTSGPSKGHHRKPQKFSKRTGADDNKSSADNTDEGSRPPRNFPQRRKWGKFNAELTDPASSVNLPAPSSQRTIDILPSYSIVPPGKSDLATTLIHGLCTPPYSECPICFNAILPTQPTWSCSPSFVARDGKDDANVQCCWATFHFHCVKSWATKSIKEIVDAWRARGEERNGEWRCPACQLKRQSVPSGYWCVQKSCLHFFPHRSYNCSGVFADPFQNPSHRVSQLPIRVLIVVLVLGRADINVRCHAILVRVHHVK
jgi:transcriptional repressor NF-X1